MNKLSLFLSLFVPFMLNGNKLDNSSSYFDMLELNNVEENNYELVGLSDNTLTDYRIYFHYEADNVEYDVISIDNNAFSNLENDITLMVSNKITNIDQESFNYPHIKQIYFTGSNAEWEAYNLTFTGSVSYYELDEGFINYWNEYVRPEETIDICEMSKADYTTLKNKYESLFASDREVVDDYKDKSGATIASTMSYLEKYFGEEGSNKPVAKSTLPKDMTLGIIVGIALFGMTTISIFYLLKKKEIIK